MSTKSGKPANNPGNDPVGLPGGLPVFTTGWGAGNINFNGNVILLGVSTSMNFIHDFFVDYIGALAIEGIL